jgi:hypothetical protein
MMIIVTIWIVSMIVGICWFKKEYHSAPDIERDDSYGIGWGIYD